MKTIKLCSLRALLVFAGLNSFAAAQNVTPADKGFAVVELFTSEGCSSCPPADVVIEKIAQEVTDKPVYILAYHVDYWNRLGWKDIFSSADYSRRQSTYAGWLKLSSVYTPQVVVNGRTEFVGSEEKTLRKAIAEGLKQPASTTLSLTGLNVNGSSARVQYHTNAASGKNMLLLALVQKKATVVVKAGENKGHTLSHVQIVSNFKNTPLSAASGEAGLKLPADFSAKNFELIALVQDNQTGAITAATRISFPAIL